MKKLNVKHLEQIKAHLREEPLRYNQTNWGSDRTGCEDAPACNTTGCIGGWEVFLHVPRKNWLKWINRINEFGVNPKNFFGIPLKAKNLLGLTSKEACQLFQPGNQLYTRGPQGVESAIKKIDALIANRRKFAKGYSEVEWYG